MAGKRRGNRQFSTREESPKCHTDLRLPAVLSASVLALLGGCAQMDMGSSAAKTEATGSAGGANAQNANSKLERCEATLGTMAIVEDTNAMWYQMLSGQMKLGSTVPVLKLLAQQSNFFVIVERGQAMNNMMRKRAMQQTGELRKQSNFGKGQMVSADYSLSPSVTFSNQDAGGGGLGGIGYGGAVVGLLAASLQFKEASTMLTLIDNRSGVQLAAAEGSARNVDMGGLGALFGSAFGSVGGGYSNTAEGKVVVAAFTDSFNNIIRAVKDYKAQEVKGGLGTGGNMQVQGADKPGAAAAKKSAPQKKVSS